MDSAVSIYPKIIEEPHFACVRQSRTHAKCEPFPNFRIGSTHRPGLCPEDVAPAGQLTNKILISMLELSQQVG